MAKTHTVDGYLAGLSKDKRAALEHLRRAIHVVVPAAEECISYQIPAFRLNGKVLVWFGAGANHCALYPGAVVEAYKDELREYDISKGTIRFPPDRPLPRALVRALVEARIAKIAIQTRPRAASLTTKRPGRSWARRQKRAKPTRRRRHEP
jgi:uncharacterized protein YdhG (YjbR/CyaY superfamily)